MQVKEPIGENNQVYFRLIALWVVCEALLGGIIHGLHLPVSGLIVGSSAVICICLIAWYAPGKGTILKATLIVAVFKMMLSPHSPLPAYFAVFFQGFLGELLFFNKKYFRTACILLGTLALVESAVQRIIVMTLVYGKVFWDSVNEFIYGFTKQSASYSLYLIAGYLFMHFIAGMMAGLFASRLPQKILLWNRDGTFLIHGENMSLLPEKKKKNRVWILLFTSWTIFFFMWILTITELIKPILPGQVVLQLLLRSVFIVLTWWLVISPILTRVLKNWLRNKQTHLQKEIEEIMLLLPSARYLVTRSWQLSSGKKGFSRLSQFSKLVLLNTLSHA